MKRASVAKTTSLLGWLMPYVLALSLQCVAQELEPETKLTQYAHKAWDIGDAGLLGTPQSITQTRAVIYGSAPATGYSVLTEFALSNGNLSRERYW